MISLNADRWRAVKAILADALSVDPSERAKFVHAACNGDRDLSREVMDMLLLDGVEAEGLETPAAESFFAERSPVGKRIDRYEILEELGAGGMGAVYLAERNEGTFKQKVALKLIRQGLASREILSRFVNERQILAALQHENIAHLIDGGTTDAGDPYLVMEYVEGSPITKYVEDDTVDLKRRLRLFLQVCSAVSYAHQKLVIHRDLKPSNILVTPAGVPKLLDFGIAKILDEGARSSDITATHKFIFTPEYASPEQVCGESLTTATDIYSLGVILYELLTGQRPYKTETANITQLVRIVCESNPTVPSRLKTITASADDGQLPAPHFKSELRGDLDSIVLKALRKEPDRRYESVAAFADDIKCYLDGQPVSARSGTWRYRTSKFIRRNRVSVAAGGLLLLALVSGLVTTLYQARIAWSERALAEKRFNDVRKLANSFVFEINDEIDKSPIRARSLLVQRAIEYLDQLANESSSDESLISELAAAYEKIGDVQAEIFRPNLGNAGGALESHRKALQLRAELYERNRNDAERALALANSYLKVGSLYTVTGDIGAASESYQKARDICEQTAEAHRGDIDVRKVLASATVLLGQSTLRSGSLSQSLARYNEAFALYAQIAQEQPTPENTRRLSVVHSYIGWVKVLTGDTSGAVDDFQSALAIEREIFAGDPDNARNGEYLETALLWLGIGYREAGRLGDSLEYVQQAIQMQESRLQADPQNFGEKNSMGDCLLELGQDLNGRGDLKGAAAAFEKAEKYYAAVYENDANDLSARVQAQMARRLRADVLLSLNEAVQARDIYQQVLQVMTDVVKRDGHNLDWRYELALTLAGKGRSELDLKQVDARQDLESAKKMLADLKQISPNNVRYQEHLSIVEKALL